MPLGMINDWRAKMAAVAAERIDLESAEAMIAMMTGVAFADGELEPAEKAKLGQAITAHPMLKEYDTVQLMAKHNELAGNYDFGPEVGAGGVLKELRDMAKADIEKKRMVLLMGVASARSDGEIEPAEIAFIKRACQTMNVPFSDLGIPE